MGGILIPKIYAVGRTVEVIVEAESENENPGEEG